MRGTATPFRVDLPAALRTVTADLATLAAQGNQARYKAMLRAYENERLQVGMIWCAIKQAASFSWDHTARETLTIYKECGVR